MMFKFLGDRQCQRRTLNTALAGSVSCSVQHGSIGCTENKLGKARGGDTGTSIRV